jgi:hypothetical protein
MANASRETLVTKRRMEPSCATSAFTPRENQHRGTDKGADHRNAQFTGNQAHREYRQTAEQGAKAA